MDEEFIKNLYDDVESDMIILGGTALEDTL